MHAPAPTSVRPVPGAPHGAVHEPATMSLFAIDIGNTRLKWALYESTQPGSVALD